MKKILFPVVIFLYLLGFPGAVFAVTTYYVSPTGSGTVCSESAPCSLISTAAGKTNPGDTVSVAAGTYNERVTISRSGSSGLPITFQAQDPNGAKPVTKGFSIGTWDIITNYIIIDGFEVANTEWHYWNASISAGIYIKGAYNTIENNYIHDALKLGIYLYGRPNDSTLSHDNTVRNNRLYRNVDIGISVNGRNNVIEKNEIWGIVQCHPNLTKYLGTDCHQYAAANNLDADGIRFFGSGHTIRGNYIHDIVFGPPGYNLDPDPANADYVDNPHIDCFQTFVGTDSEVAQNIVFEQNYCDNLQFQNDYEKGQGWMISGNASNITIKNNVVRAYRGINTNGGDGTQANHLYIYNNTFINNISFPAQPNVAELPNPVGSIIKNNIFYDQKNATIDLSGDTTGLVIDYNLVYNSDGSLPIFMSYPISHELRGKNPQFVNPNLKDYHLQSTSPAIDTGVDLKSAGVINDFDGMSRPQGPGFDIGAFEYDFRISNPSPSPTPDTTIKPGDLNGDGHVDLYDYNILVSYFGNPYTIYDYNSLVTNFGK